MTKCIFHQRKRELKSQDELRANFKFMYSGLIILIIKGKNIAIQICHN